MKTAFCITLSLFLTLGSTNVFTDAKKHANNIRTVEVSEGLYVLMGNGGNIGLHIGEDGTFLIDDQYKPMSEKVEAAIKSLGGSLPKFIINTHWHGDHTGGNEHFGNTGSVIVAHKNVRERLSSEQFVKAFNFTSPPQPEAAKPVVTFEDGVTFHFNNETIDVKHFPNAHTDGDSYLKFKNANVIHTGDLFFNGFYPFIDAGSNGSVSGMIKGVKAVLALCDKNTKIIPGHGPIATKKDLKNYLKMLKTAHKAIKKLKDKGMSREEVMAANPTAKLDKKWGNGIFKGDVWSGIVYDGIK
ncbi:MAG: MBL fold metallo-hydrolase [Agarilytica sp.]